MTGSGVAGIALRFNRQNRKDIQGLQRGASLLGLWKQSRLNSAYLPYLCAHGLVAIIGEGGGHEKVLPLPVSPKVQLSFWGAFGFFRFDFPPHGTGLDQDLGTICRQIIVKSDLSSLPLIPRTKYVCSC
jgi:hypothetical protein